MNIFVSTQGQFRNTDFPEMMFVITEVRIFLSEKQVRIRVSTVDEELFYEFVSFDTLNSEMFSFTYLDEKNHKYKLIIVNDSYKITKCDEE